MARQLFYSRAQVARLCGVKPRTVIRWEGVFLTKLKDPSDPSGRRVMYEGTEVENLLRRRYRHESDPAHATARQRKRRKKAPKKSDDGGNAKRRAPVPRAKLAEPPPAPPAPEAARESGNAGPPSSRSRLRDEADRALERWDREIDERKRRWEEEHPDETPPAAVPDSKKTKR